jgi:hypothetical protein
VLVVTETAIDITIVTPMEKFHIKKPAESLIFTIKKHTILRHPVYGY